MQLKNSLPNKLFSNFKLQKHRIALFNYFRYRIRINYKIVDIALLTLTFTILPLLFLLPLHWFAWLEIIACLNQNRTNGKVELIKCKSVYYYQITFPFAEVDTHE